MQKFAESCESFHKNSGIKDAKEFQLNLSSLQVTLCNQQNTLILNHDQKFLLRLKKSVDSFAYTLKSKSILQTNVGVNVCVLHICTACTVCTACMYCMNCMHVLYVLYCMYCMHIHMRMSRGRYISLLSMQLHWLQIKKALIKGTATGFVIKS